MDSYQMLEDFPEQFKAVDVPSLEIDHDGFVFSGMGGSGIVGDFMRLFLKVDKPILSIKGYELPSFVKKSWLLVCTSYSGNTEETISILEESLRRGLEPLCVSSGGALQEISKERGLLHLPLPHGYPPRYALGFMFSTLLSLFGMGGEVEKIREHLKEHKEEIKSEAKSIAKNLFGYLPVVYGTPLTESVAFRWKTQINENSKTLCYNAFLPEMHHNEVVGLDNPSIRSLCHFILLKDAEDHPRIARRVTITEEVFKELGIVLKLLQGKGSTLIERLMYLTYLGDWVSFYLAELYQQDPVPVKVIDYIKKNLI
ncbi:MAG: bifunctional phosphoglucose/phosphomannose isomerase [Aquificaceae bacterium]